MDHLVKLALVNAFVVLCNMVLGIFSIMLGHFILFSIQMMLVGAGCMAAINCAYDYRIKLKIEGIIKDELRK